MQEEKVEQYLSASRNDARVALERIIEGFDFEKAAVVLFSCDWKFVGAARSPTAEELTVIARDIAMRAIESGTGCRIGQGPLQCHVHHYHTASVPVVELHLVPVESHAVYFDARQWINDPPAEDVDPPEDVDTAYRTA